MILQAGDTGFMVEKLQKALAAKGFYIGTTVGKYTPDLVEATKSFQKSISLEADGIAGQSTLNALGMRRTEHSVKS